MIDLIIRVNLSRFILQESWRYSSKWSNSYSLVLMGSAIYHSYYDHLYHSKIPSSAHLLVNSIRNCDDILINLLTVKVIKRPPIKILSRRISKEYNTGYVNCRTQTWNEISIAVNQLYFFSGIRRQTSLIWLISMFVLMSCMKYLAQCH